MAKKTPGLFKRRRAGGSYTWVIDKVVKGYGRLCESCGTDNLSEAEEYLQHRLREVQQAVIYGVRPTRTFEEAAQRYLDENQHRRAIERAVHALQAVMPYIGHLPIEKIHDGTLERFKRNRLKAGRTAGTINRDLGVVRRVLMLAARVWRHENGLSWLEAPPLIQMVEGEARKPYPLEWSEQDALFKELPKHLQEMALYAVNTGCREKEVCQLRWSWEVRMPEIGTSLFVLPKGFAKNGEERIVVLNRAAHSVIESRRREKHPEFVFAYKGKPITKILNSGWKRARHRAGLPHIRVHDLRHTFGHRLRACGVSFEDRQDLLGHKAGRITTHYSAPDVLRLLESANKVCERRQSTILRVASPAKLPHEIPRSAVVR